MNEKLHDLGSLCFRGILSEQDQPRTAFLERSPRRPGP